MKSLLLALIVSLAATPTIATADTVTCSDGTTSEAGRGACSHHGGVAKTRAPRDTAPRKSEARKSTTRASRVRCNDGTFSSASGRGACSRHGGVADDGAILTDRTRDRVDTRKRKTEKEPEQSGGLVVRCADGSISIATGRGACSHHGGVVEEQARTPTERRRETTKRNKPWWGDEGVRDGEPLARCMDGSISYSKHHRGTCSQHGGVRDWLDD